MQKACINRPTLKSWSLLISLICLIIFGTGIASHAQSSGGFSIRAVIPDNQVDINQTYFDLRMKPGDEQSVQIVITNSRSEELRADIRLNAASTGRNGLIVYTEEDVRDEIMKVSITDVAALQTEQITVPALGSKTVTIHIKMPDEPIDGVILGGISVTEHEIKDDNHVEQGTALKNTFTYVTALKITQNDEEVDPDFDLTDIKPSLINYRTAVIVTLQNKAPRIVKGIEINAQVFKKNSDTALHMLTLDNAEMAPLSKGNFVIDWENQPLSQGVYRLKMVAHYNGQTWEWDEEFIIAEEANDLNEQAVELIRNDTWLYILTGVAALILVWIVAYHMGKRKKNGN